MYFFVIKLAKARILNTVHAERIEITLLFIIKSVVYYTCVATDNYFSYPDTVAAHPMLSFAMGRLRHHTLGAYT